MDSMRNGVGGGEGQQQRVVAAATVVDVRRDGHKHRLVRAANVFSFDGGDGARVRQTAGRPPPSASPMAAAGLEELVECLVCGERLRQPRMLPCQHTFCADCLVERLHTKKGRSYGVVRCAACGLELQLALGAADASSAAASVLALPRNVYLESLLRLVEQQPPPTPAASADPHDLPCSRCGTVGATATRCQHCKLVLCEVCWPAHLDDLQQQLGALARELEGASERLRHRLHDYQERCEAVAARAAAAAETRRKAVRREEERVAGEVVALRERAQEDARALGQELQAARDAMRSDECGAAFDPLADNHNKVAEFLRAHGSTAALLARVARWGDARPAFDAEGFRVELLAAEDAAPAPGPAPVAAPAPAPDADDEQPPETTDADDPALRYRVRAWAPRLSVRRSALQRPAGTALAPWAGELFVAAADAHAVLVLDWARGRLLRRLAAPELLCPQGVGFSAKQQEVYVTDKFNHCVHVFSREGALLRSLGRKGSAPGQLRAPEGLAAAPGPDGEDLLYVCDAGNDRVQVLRAETGAAVRELGVLQAAGRGTPAVTEFNQPTGVALSDALGLLAVTDCGNNRVKLYALPSLAKVRELGSRGTRRGQLRAPEGVALDAQGFVVVSDAGNARLQVFRADDGRLERVLGAGTLQWPAGVCITPQRDLVVTDARAHAVYVL